MSRHQVVAAMICAGLAAAATFAFAQSRFSGNNSGRRWARYEAEMQDPIDDPPDAWVDTEFVFARLRYHSIFDRGGFRRARWGTDANKSERLFMQGLRRLTRIQTRSVEEVVDIESDNMFNFPWLYAVGAGDWNITPEQGARLKEYFERGGFLMVDDFHNDREWNGFMAGINQMFDNPRVIEIADEDAIFNNVYNMNDRVQISGFQIIYGYPAERGGIVPHWRAVVDSQNRVQVAICFNMDVGDAWEWSDYPPYPEKLASLAYRLGVNYTIYDLTH